MGGPPARGPEVFELEVRAADELDSGWLGEDSIETGPPDRPWAWQAPQWFERFSHAPTAFVVVALVIALGVAAGISIAHPNQPLAAPPPAATASDPPVVLDPSQQAIATMVAEAQSPIALADYVISDDSRAGCRPVQPPDTDPVQTIAAMVGKYEPTFTLRDSAKGIEESGTCSMQLRFTDTVGTTLIVTVSPPPNVITPMIALQNDDRASAMDIVADVDGWRVEVGAVGQPGQLPTQNELTSIATDERIHW